MKEAIYVDWSGGGENKTAPAVTRRKKIGGPISFQREQHELKVPQERSDEETEAVPAKRVRRKGNQHFLT